MHLLLKLRQWIGARGDNWQPEWLETLARTTCADGWPCESVASSVVQPGNHPDSVPVVPPKGDLMRSAEKQAGVMQ